jgi:hypothetical protein
MYLSKFLLGIFLLVFVSSKAQQRIDSSYRSSYYEHKLTQFKILLIFPIGQNCLAIKTLKTEVSVQIILLEF